MRGKVTETSEEKLQGTVFQVYFHCQIISPLSYNYIIIDDIFRSRLVHNPKTHTRNYHSRVKEPRNTQK